MCACFISCRQPNVAGIFLMMSYGFAVPPNRPSKCPHGVVLDGGEIDMNSFLCMRGLKPE